MSSAAPGAILDELLALGPRATGSEGETTAAAWTAARMERAGLAVRVAPIRVSRRPYALATRVLPAVLAILFLGAAVAPVLSLVLVAALLALPSVLRRADRLFDGGTPVSSANVEGRTAPWIEGRPALVISAHLDAKTTLLPLRIRILLLAGALLAILVLQAAWAANFRDTRLAAGLLGAAFLLGAALDRPRPTSAGALDDGSGLAVLLALAQTLPARTAGRCNLLFLATGAEEVGMAGALRWVQAGAGGLDPAATWAVNLDILGTAGPVWIAGGRVPRAEVARALRERGFRTRFLPFLVGAGMDHQRLARAFPAISLTQGPGPASRWVHRPGDTRDKVDAGILERLAAAIADVAERR